MLSVCILRLVSLSLVLLPNDRHKYYFQLVGCALVMCRFSFWPASRQCYIYYIPTYMKNLTQRVVINNFNGKWLCYIRRILYVYTFSDVCCIYLAGCQALVGCLPYFIRNHALLFAFRVLFGIRCSYIIRTIAY